MATENDHPQSIIFKVSEAVGTALNELHLAVEALCILVPDQLREAAKALGAPTWYMIPMFVFDNVAYGHAL